MTLTLLIVAVVLALSVSAMCSLLESALLSLTPGQVADLKRRRPAIGAIWERFKSNIEQPISVILICNTAAHTIGATVAGAEFEKYMAENYDAGGWSILAFGVVFTFLMLQFTEILPKTLGVRYNRAVATATGRPMAALVLVMRPVLWAVRQINRPFESRSQQDRPAVSVNEIVTLAAMARTGRVIDAQQERMIRMAGKLGQIRVRQIMTPRHDVRFISLSATPAEQLRLLREVSYTRLPICEDDLDHVLGVMHLRDFFNAVTFPQEEGEPPAGEPAVPDIRKLMRPVNFVPENQPVDKLLRQFQSGKSHLAIVVDEYGATQGVVTLEDVLEELVGDIEDEFDEGEHVWRLMPLRPQVAGENEFEGEPKSVAWRCAGDVPIREISDRLGFEVKEEEIGTVVTLGGFVTRELGRWPLRGDEVVLAGWRVRVRHVDEGRVVEAILLPPRE